MNSNESIKTYLDEDILDKHRRHKPLLTETQNTKLEM